MSNYSLKQAVITAMITLIVGVILFGISEFAKGLFITPIIKLREHNGVIIDRLIYYADKIINPIKVGNVDNKTYQDQYVMKEHLRSAASQLLAKSEAIPLYGFWSFCHLIPPKNKMEKVAENIIGIQNSLMPTDDDAVVRFADRNIKRYNNIKEILNLPEV